ncbi:heat-inducible transcriptional repressor HrcA [Aquiluna borgnonia]|uniref:Heat-inducible transcription repressor HrcA n=1 Tax=Aquiluna borgnonia TaxID=2499157 RepID=A0A7D4ULK2_9MICO|nr:heat-inducible transcriptional repressor HrcA [Aquiluna borgnonia]QKJ25178.1 heat-inducible transcriptional repressor HrcA [Aquiluna borgnonia]
MIPERSLEVLRAIVQDFIYSSQPVGSKSLLDRHPLGVSAATIRNDMALLEEEQLIVAPHTSAGRIPTEKGYRLFVDKLSDLKPLSQAEKSAIENFLVGANDIDDIVERTARQLAQLTNTLALVQYPSLGKSRVRHIELIPLNSARVLLMLITDSGRIQQHQVEVAELDDAVVQELRGRLNGTLAGLPLAEVKAKVSGLVTEFSPARRAAIDVLISALLELVDENRLEKIMISGAANLVKQEQDFSGDLSRVLQEIEEQVVLLKLLEELSADQHGVGLRIGSEIGNENLRSASILVTGYENNGAEIAKLGVLGPTRMDYSGNIAAVRAVARYLTKILEGNS